MGDRVDTSRKYRIHGTSRRYRGHEAWLKNQEIDWKSPIGWWRFHLVCCVERDRKTRLEEKSTEEMKRGCRVCWNVEGGGKGLCTEHKGYTTGSESGFRVKSNSIIMATRTEGFNFENGCVYDSPRLANQRQKYIENTIVCEKWKWKKCRTHLSFYENISCTRERLKKAN